ncbi:hypothetical protein IFR05_011874 [Cadophora sp. M221]|nr:hypothetical protein IFR05_011874 [Cadophora sp. M221]
MAKLLDPLPVDNLVKLNELARKYHYEIIFREYHHPSTPHTFLSSVFLMKKGPGFRKHRFSAVFNTDKERVGFDTKALVRRAAAGSAVAWLERCTDQEKFKTYTLYLEPSLFPADLSPSIEFKAKVASDAAPMNSGRYVTKFLTDVILRSRPRRMADYKSAVEFALNKGTAGSGARQLMVKHLTGDMMDPIDKTPVVFPINLRLIEAAKIVYNFHCPTYQASSAHGFFVAKLLEGMFRHIHWDKMCVFKAAFLEGACMQIGHHLHGDDGASHEEIFKNMFSTRSEARKEYAEMYFTTPTYTCCHKEEFPVMLEFATKVGFIAHLDTPELVEIAARQLGKYVVYYFLMAGSGIAPGNWIEPKKIPSIGAFFSEFGVTMHELGYERLVRALRQGKLPEAGEESPVGYY